MMDTNLFAAQIDMGDSTVYEVWGKKNIEDKSPCLLFRTYSSLEAAEEFVRHLEQNTELLNCDVFCIVKEDRTRSFI